MSIFYVKSLALQADHGLGIDQLGQVSYGLSAVALVQQGAVFEPEFQFLEGGLLEGVNNHDAEEEGRADSEPDVSKCGGGSRHGPQHHHVQKHRRQCDDQYHNYEADDLLGHGLLPVVDGHALELGLAGCGAHLQLSRQLQLQLGHVVALLRLLDHAAMGCYYKWINEKLTASLLLLRQLLVPLGRPVRSWATRGFNHIGLRLGGAQYLPDLLDGAVYLGGGGGPPGQLYQYPLDVLDALPLEQQPLHILLGLLQLPGQSAVLLPHVVVVLLHLAVLLPQHQDLLLPLLDVIDQVRIGLVGLVQQRPGNLQFVLDLLQLHLLFPQGLQGFLMVPLLGLQPLG